MQARKIEKAQRLEIIEEILNSIFNFLETYMEKGILKNYEVTISLSDDWPYLLNIELNYTPSPLADKKLIDEMADEALNLGFKKAKKLFQNIGLVEV